LDILTVEKTDSQYNVMYITT